MVINNRIRWTLLAICSFFVFISSCKKDEMTELHAVLVYIEDNKLFADSIDTLNIVEKRSISDMSYRRITLGYNIKNTSNQTLFIPFMTSLFTNGYKSTVRIVCNFSSHSPFAVGRKQSIIDEGIKRNSKDDKSFYLYPNETMFLKVAIHQLFSVAEERKDKMTINEIINGLQLNYVVDTVDIKYSNRPIPNIIFDNKITEKTLIKYRLAGDVVTYDDMW